MRVGSFSAVLCGQVSRAGRTCHMNIRDLLEPMFARKIRVEYEEKGQKLPCPLRWLDSFSMRSFTNASVFDDTLPVSDGQMEIGARVPLDQLKDAMEDWFRRKGYLAKESSLSLADS
jgi:hypothetical protein